MWHKVVMGYFCSVPRTTLEMFMTYDLQNIIMIFFSGPVYNYKLL